MGVLNATATKKKEAAKKARCVSQLYSLASDCVSEAVVGRQGFCSEEQPSLSSVKPPKGNIQWVSLGAAAGHCVSVLSLEFRPGEQDASIILIKVSGREEKAHPRPKPELFLSGCKVTPSTGFLQQ